MVAFTSELETVYDACRVKVILILTSLVNTANQSKTDTGFDPPQTDGDWRNSHVKFT